MAGQIHRRKKNRDFVTIDTHCLRNPSLKWDAKGLHSYLMQLPDDWKINVADLEKRSANGRDGTTSPLNALIQAGYVSRQRLQNDKGQFSGYDYNLFERPEHTKEWLAENGKAENGLSESGETPTTKYDTPTELSNELKEEEKNAALSSTAEYFTLEAEKQKPIPPVAPAPLSIELHDPETPGVTIYDHIPHKGYPTTEPIGEWQRVNVPQEIEALKTDSAMREAFTMSRKIPSANYAEYLEAFAIDVQGRGEKYTTPKQLRSHFLNWSGTRFEIQSRKAKESKPAIPTGQPAKIRQL